MPKKDAFPAEPEEGYGLEKLFIEKMCEYLARIGGWPPGLSVPQRLRSPRHVRWRSREGARRDLPKIDECEDGDEIEIWGDGQRPGRSVYIDDCIEGIFRIMESDCSPL